MSIKEYSEKIVPYLGNMIDEFFKKSRKWKIQVTLVIRCASLDKN